jgi:hypothetical protein
MSVRLSGKVCVSTSTGGSVGLATAPAFAEVANVASDESSSVTGVDIVVDGGMKVW